LSLGVREALVVEKAPLARTSTPIPSLRKEEDPTVAPAADLISVPPIDVASMGVDLFVVSSDSADEVDWESLVTGDEVDWEALATKDVDDVEFVGSWSSLRI
jgi:hypothetical protein